MHKNVDIYACKCTRSSVQILSHLISSEQGSFHNRSECNVAHVELLVGRMW